MYYGTGTQVVSGILRFPLIAILSNVDADQGTLCATKGTTICHWKESDHHHRAFQETAAILGESWVEPSHDSNVDSHMSNIENVDMAHPLKLHNMFLRPSAHMQHQDCDPSDENVVAHQRLEPYTQSIHMYEDPLMCSHGRKERAHE